VKKYLKRVIKLFTDRKIWVRQIIVASVAAAVAWQLGDLWISHGGLVAAIVCSLSIRISLYKSVREGFGQIVGTAIGAGVALFSVRVFHFGFIAVGITVILCSVVARALHLGEVASVNVPVTALIVIGPGLNESTAVHRLLSTLLGAGVAIVFSYFSHPKRPEGRTIDRISALGMKSAELLGAMSEGVAAGYDQTIAGKWLSEARLLIEEIPHVRSQALEAKNYARWSPLDDLARAEELYISGVAIEHTVVQVRTMARSLFDAAVDEANFISGNRDIAIAISAASYAIERKISTIGTESSLIPADDISNELRVAGNTLAGKLIERSTRVDQEQLVRAISLVANIERIADSLDESSPALVDVKTPDEPSGQKVLQVSPIEQSSRLGQRALRVIRVIRGK